MSFNFKPVAPTAKGVTVKTQAVRFPEVAIISLSKVEIKEEGKRPSKMIELSPKAIEALGLTETGSSNLAVMRAWMDEAETVQAILVHRLDDAEGTEDKDKGKFKFVNTKGNVATIKAANINLNTGRASSSKIHDILSAEHSAAESGEEKHYKLAQEYNGLYWRLEELAPVTVEETVEPTNDEATITSTTSDSPGETVEVSVETAEDLA